MTKKENCDTCQKKVNEVVDDFYVLKRYHGKEGSAVIWECQTCYQAKKQEYLDNYSSIYFWEHDGFLPNHRVIKDDDAFCYAGKSGKDGQILNQENCRHCQPWKKFSEKACTNCGKDLSNQEMTYSSKSSGEAEKWFCSLECMNKCPKSERNPKNNGEDKGMPTEMKFFLGILVVILAFIIGIALGKIWQKNKNNKK